MLKAKGLSFGYKRHQPVFENLSVEFPKGQFSAIIGANGAGKSSLLKILSGIVQPHKGEVRLNDLPLTKVNPIDLAKQRGVLTQFTNLGFEFTVLDVVLMGRYPHFGKEPGQVDYDISYAAMELTGVLGYKDQLYQNLSGGEQQRVQLARVIAQIRSKEKMNDSILLLDEPVSSLDLKYQHSILRTARNLSREGITVVAVLHDLNLTMQYADQVMLLQQGQLTAGTPQEVITEENIMSAYGIQARIIQEPDSGKYQIITGWMEEWSPNDKIQQPL